MADITMCKGTKCPLKKECYRFTALEGIYQSYFVTPPYDKVKKECDCYWNINPKIEIKDGE